jgi:hypothetical protein
MIHLDTLRIKSYHIECHNYCDEGSITAIWHFLDFVTGVG